MTPSAPSPDVMMSQAASGYRSAIATQGIRFICKAAGVVILARVVSPAEHGRFAMAATLTFLLTLFRDFGMGTAAIQSRELTEGQKTALLQLHVGAGFLLALLTLAAAPAVAAFYGDVRVTGLIQVMSISFVLNGLNAWPRTLLNRELEFRKMNQVETTGAVIGTIAMIAGALGGLGAYAFVAFLLVSEATMLVLAWQLNAWRPQAPAAWASLRLMANTGAHLTGYNLLQYGLQQSDTLLMGRWFGATPLGLYNRAGQLLIQPMTHLAAPFNQVLTATLARLGPESPFFARQFREGTNTIAHFTLPAAVVCLVVPDDVVRIVLGAHWAGAVPLLRWLALSAAMQFLTTTTYALCVASGHAARLAQLTAVALPITLVALFSSSHYGPVGLAAALAITNVVLLVPRLGWSIYSTPVRRHDLVTAFAGPVLVSIGVAAGLIGGRLATTSGPLAWRWLAEAAGSVVAVTLCASCSPQLRREFRQIRAHLPLPRRTMEAGSSV